MTACYNKDTEPPSLPCLLPLDAAATFHSIIAVGASVSLGFMLNMFGFAYQFDWDHGLEVDTIGKIREVNQFRAAVASSSRPPSVLPK
jgi:hypothetical protein